MLWLALGTHDGRISLDPRLQTHQFRNSAKTLLALVPSLPDSSYPVYHRVLIHCLPNSANVHLLLTAAPHCCSYIDSYRMMEIAFNQCLQGHSYLLILNFLHCRQQKFFNMQI